MSNSEQDKIAPRELSVEEIKEYYELFVIAGRRAVEAGFDGVEIHGYVFSNWRFRWYDGWLLMRGEIVPMDS